MDALQSDKRVLALSAKAVSFEVQQSFAREADLTLRSNDWPGMPDWLPQQML